MEKIKTTKINKSVPSQTILVSEYGGTSILAKIIINTITLILASLLFKSISIANIGYALLASIIITVLDIFLKPTLVLLTLPITLVSLGILYPIVNVIILKTAALFLGNKFIVSGLFFPFLISIFISYLNISFERAYAKRKTR